MKGRLLFFFSLKKTISEISLKLYYLKIKNQTFIHWVAPISETTFLKHLKICSKVNWLICFLFLMFKKNKNDEFILILFFSRNSKSRSQNLRSRFGVQIPCRHYTQLISHTWHIQVAHLFSTKHCRITAQTRRLRANIDGL